MSDGRTVKRLWQLNVLADENECPQHKQVERTGTGEGGAVQITATRQPRQLKFDSLGREPLKFGFVIIEVPVW